MSGEDVEDTGEASADRLVPLLEGCMESGRLTRAGKLADKVRIAVEEPGLYVAAVSSYNVSVDVERGRIVHGCRDFRREAPAGRLCKHVGALLLALDPEVSEPIVRGLTAQRSGWRLECIRRYGSS